MNALLIDVGNTRIKWCVLESDHGDRWLGPARAIARTDLQGLDAAFRALSSDTPALDAAFVSNVADARTEADVAACIERAWRGTTARVVRPERFSCGVVNGYRDPASLGTDRWLALIGARASMPRHDLLVCSFGTATTIDLLEEDPSDDARSGRALHVGGSILPGLVAMRTALAGTTARLPFAEGEVVPFADRTEDAIASGVMAAQVGAVRQAFRAAAARRVLRPSAQPVACILAGGDAAAIARHLRSGWSDGRSSGDPAVRIVPDLVLLGLAEVACERCSGDCAPSERVEVGPMTAAAAGRP